MNVRERPILFSAPMIRALLAGTKTQTRRMVKSKWSASCPYGQPGDRLWVREAWRTERHFDHLPPRDLDPTMRATPVQYEAGPAADVLDGKLRPGMFMPRWASRITLEITGVRIEQLQDISEADAIAEGAPSADLVSGRECIFPHQGLHRWGFQLLWQQINGLDSWTVNPWVWVVEFKQVKVPHG